MLKKSTRLTLEIFMAIITTLFLASMIFVWRLSHGPIEIPSLNYYLQSNLTNLSQNVNVTIGKTVLQWGGLKHPFFINTKNIRLTNKLGGEILFVDEVTIDLSIPDLFIARVRPLHIGINNPSLSVKRLANGQMDINMTNQKEANYSSEINQSDFSINDILQILSDRDLQGIAEKLDSITISDADIFYQDIPNSFSMISQNSNIHLARNDRGISGAILMNVEIAGKTETLTGKIEYDFERQESQIILAIKDFNPSALSTISRNFELMKRFDIPLTGYFSVSLNNFLQILSLNLSAQGTDGVIFIPQIYDTPLQIDQANLNLTFDPSQNKIFLENLNFDIDNFKAELHGDLISDLSRGALFVDATANIYDIQSNQISRYWPEFLADSPRKWITQNIRDAIIPKATADFKFSVPFTDFTLIDIEKLDGSILIKDALIDYLSPMPVVKNVDAVARFDTKSFLIDIESGQLRESLIEHGFVHITDLDQENSRMDIDLKIDGPLQDALYTINQPPLKLTQGMGFDAEKIKAHAKTNLQLSFPLMSHLQKPQIRVKATAEIENLLAEEIVDGQTVTADVLSLKASNDNLTLDGDIRVNDVLAQLNWVEEFSSQSEYRRIMNVSGLLTVNDIEKITHYDLQKYMTGTLQAQAIIKNKKVGQKSTVIELNLKDASVSIPQVNYKKEKGQDSQAHFQINKDNQNKTKLENIVLQAPDLSIRGQILMKDNAVETLNFDQFKLFKNDFSLSLSKEGSRYNANIKGALLDLSDILEKIQNNKKSAVDQPNKNPKYPALFLSGEVDQLALSKQPENFQNVEFMVDLYPDRINRLEVDARANQADIYLRYRPDPSGNGHTLRFESDNAGNVLKAVGVTDKISGGIIIIDGKTASNNLDLVTGGLTIKNFKIVKAPILGQIVNAVSPVGLIEMLNSDGINFMQLQSKWSYQDRVLNFETGRMAGSSLGLNYQGPINFATRYMDIKGTIVPVDPLNRVIGSLPIVGQILGGIDGDGLFAATYEIKGDIKNPKVTVNPLAALAPGILRSIFFESGL